MNDQLWVSRHDAPLSRDLLYPVRMQSRAVRSLVTNRLVLMPVGGLWSSSVVDEGSAWTGLVCRTLGSDSLEWKSCAIIHADPDARVMEISSSEDLDVLHERYGFTMTTFVGPDMQPLPAPIVQSLINWNALAKDVDAVHLTHKGRWNTAFDERPLGWDVESTFWLRWAFTAETFGPHRYGQYTTLGET